MDSFFSTSALSLQEIQEQGAILDGEARPLSRHRTFQHLDIGLILLHNSDTFLLFMNYQLTILGALCYSNIDALVQTLS